MSETDTSCVNVEPSDATTNDDGAATTTVARIMSKRQESKYTLHWTFDDFSCTMAELPSINFEFELGKNTMFRGRLCLIGETCDKSCILFLKKLEDKPFQVHCTLRIKSHIFHADFYQLFSAEHFSLLASESCLLDQGLNIITLEVERVNYVQQEQEILSFETPQSAMHTNMETLFEWRHFEGDIVFIVAGEEITAHKSVLAGRSIYFFFKILANIDPSKPILLDNITPEVFTEILRYIYTDNVPNLKEMPKELFIASRRYQLEALQLRCESELINRIDAETAPELIEFAQRNAAKLLKRRAVDFLVDHRKQMRKAEICEKEEIARCIEELKHSLQI